MKIILCILAGGIVLCALIMVVYLVNEIIMAIYHKTLRYEVFLDTAVVCNKEYEEGYTTTTVLPVGKVMVPQTHYHDEEYNVYLMYEGAKHCFDDEDLYKKVSIGDECHVLVHKGYNKFNQLKNVYLSID